MLPNTLQHTRRPRQHCVGKDMNHIFHAVLQICGRTRCLIIVYCIKLVHVCDRQSQGKRKTDRQTQGEQCENTACRSNSIFCNFLQISQGLDDKPTDNFGFVVLALPRAQEIWIKLLWKPKINKIYSWNYRIFAVYFSSFFPQVQNQDVIFLWCTCLTPLL